MSGGHFNYAQHHIRDIADEVDQLIRDNDRTDKNQYGDTIGYGFGPEIIAKFEEALLTLRRAEVMAQRIDWLVSCDDGPESFLRRWDEELKKLEVCDEMSKM